MITTNCELPVDEGRVKGILAEIGEDEMGGWLELPRKVDMAELARVRAAAQKIREESEVMVCIGIGGSYLGHRAAMELLGVAAGLDVVYAGNSLSERALEQALDTVGDRDFSVVVISKSGTTLEPARAFAAFREKLEGKYGAEAAGRIYAVTDGARGMLHDEAVERGYERFAIPEDVGGRYSVLTSVGLLAMAAFGVDVTALLAGAAEEAELVARAVAEGRVAELAAVRYATMRRWLAERGFDTEVFACFEPAGWALLEWLKQLFGESEGKNGQGVWPASVVYSTDLHSLGQFMQEGRRNIWETIVNLPTDEVNSKLVTATRLAHAEGGLPVLMIEVPSLDARGLGALFYFFEVACAVSAKLAGVNPFDQPGVEKYKTELKRLIS